MTYMTYHFLLTLMTLIPALIWFGVSIWVALDAEKMTDEAWARAGESKNVWVAISILLAWPFGLIFYFFTVRKKVAAFARTIHEDALIVKATDRLRNENKTERAAYITPAESVSSDGRSSSYPDHYAAKDAQDADETKAAAEKKADDDAVFDYEESEADDNRYSSGQVIPPKPDYHPTVGNSATEKDEENSETKTMAYPVVPPKPTHAPRVGTEGNEG